MSTQKQFVASDENKGKAKQLRLFALLAWLVAIAGEVYAILYLIKDDKLTWLIVAIVVMLILSVVGSMLWKKSNRLDPASEKDGFRFFVQNQLGAIIAVIAFLPLVLFIFLNKDASKKTKGVAGAVAVVALLIAGISGIDFNPPSIEKYTKEINEQTDVVKKINLDRDAVYWTTAGNKYHVYDDCQHIKGREIAQGTVKECWEKKSISELCKTCEKRAMKQNNLSLPMTDSTSVAD